MEARTSINPMLARTKAVWADLEPRGEIERDLIAHVKPLRNKDDADAHDGALDLSDRLAKHSAVRFPVVGGVRSAEHRAVIHAHLALIGLRRGELAGLRWSAVDLEVGTITAAARTRVRVTGKTLDQKHGKTATSARTLPLPASTLAILRGARERQRAARNLAGDSWTGDRDLHMLTPWTAAPLRPASLTTGGSSRWGTPASSPVDCTRPATPRRRDWQRPACGAIGSRFSAVSLSLCSVGADPDRRQEAYLVL